MNVGKAGPPSTADTTLRLAALGIFVLALAAAGAQAAPRAFVASNGSDANPCTLPQPCRGFTAAIAAADAGGEVIVLDSAGYGPVTITKSISIVAPPGVYAGISVSSGDGITVNGAGINVALKGLSINGQGGSRGIVFTQGASLVIEHCSTTNFTTDGIRLDAASLVVVSETVASANGANGISVNNSATVSITGSRMVGNVNAGVYVPGAANVTVDRTVMDNNENGIFVLRFSAGTVRVAVDSSSVIGDIAGVSAFSTAASAVMHVDVTRSTLARGNSGFYAQGSSGGSVIVGLTDNDIVDNLFNGITADGAGATVRASNNRIMRNGGGFALTSGGTIFTPGTNYVRDNGLNDGGHTADTLL